MLVIGEKIHILNPLVHEAVESRNIAPVVELAVRQVEAGAHALDINLGPGRRAGSLLPEIIEEIQQRVDTSFLFPADAPEFTNAIKACRNRATVNAVTADIDNLQRTLAAADCFDANVVVLLTREGVLPWTVDQWCLMAEEVIETAEARKFPLERLYLDPLLRTRFNPGAPGTGTSAMEFGPVLQAIKLIGELRAEGIKTIAGLSNISLHLPAGSRSLMHQSVLALLKAAGLSAIIMNPLDSKLMEIASSEPMPDILTRNEQDLKYALASA